MPFRNTPARLESSGSAVFGANGIATIELGPMTRGEVWRIQRITVSTDDLADTMAKIYRNVIGDSTFLEGTYAGNSDISDTGYEFLTPEKLIVQWTGGTAGKIAFLRIEGEKVHRNMW